ncbi:sialidase family protein [Paenibacillus antarcticus]|uniref:Sialidase domain-containing protein n=1 Tax=Paenibacillus antarcticus TaxID=253703 RepID=A0A168QVG1_9BACL|nr:sialidase family protein [Paenibacillus antarcticus]OAB48263.1 hypothetical protein PBAT_01075 [Paenibacillus antarcticus]
MPSIVDSTVVASAYDTSGNGGKKLVRLSNGWLIAIVKDLTEIGYKLYKSINNGATFSLLYTHALSGSIQDVAIVPNGTNVYIICAWLNNAVQCYGYNCLIANGISGAIFNVDIGQTALGNVSLATNEAGTELHATWSSKNTTYPTFNLRYAKGAINASTGAVTWGAVDQITNYVDSYLTVIQPSIVVSSNNNPTIVATWINSNSTFLVVAYTRNSGVWQTGYTRIYNQTGGATGYAQSSPSAVFVPKSVNGLTNGRIWVAWHGKDATVSADNIRVSYSDDNGTSWSTPQIVTDSVANNNSSFYFPSISANKRNEIFITYTGSFYGVCHVKNIGGVWAKQYHFVAGYNFYPSALDDVTIDFSMPLLIYKGDTKVGFYGTWGVVTNSVAQGSIGAKSSKDSLLVYTITTDNTMSTITEKVNGVTVGTKTAISGQALTVGLTQVQWDAVKFGKYATTAASNILTISMGTDAWTYTFDKRLPTGADIEQVTKALQDTQGVFLPAVKSKLNDLVYGGGDSLDGLIDKLESNLSSLTPSNLRENITVNGVVGTLKQGKAKYVGTHVGTGAVIAINFGFTWRSIIVSNTYGSSWSLFRNPITNAVEQLTSPTNAPTPSNVGTTSLDLKFWSSGGTYTVMAYED